MLLAQITDCHVTTPGRYAYRIVDTCAALRRAVDALLALRPSPDAVVVTGDLVYEGHKEEYEVVAHELARLSVPVFALPGNHDAREPFRAVLGPRFCPAEDAVFLHFSYELGETVLIGLDTLLPGSHGGVLCPARLSWLERALAAARERPVILALHHPPFATGIAHMDRIALANAEDLERLVRRHGRVERVICGHVHRSVQTLWAGTLASVAPSTAHQVELALEPAAPSCFTLEPPGLHLHTRLAGGGLVTHLLPLGDWPGPYRFAEYAD